ncbi:MAG: PilZ domain-containing protein [Chromatiaceae bacterium]|nr:PilZ domain-containing protein [Chromatiaceae bacterium]
MALSDSASIDRRQQRQTLASEPRRFVRKEVPCYARLELLPRKYGGIYHGFSHNLSVGGVKVRTFQQLRVDSNVLVQLCCSEDVDPLTLSGAVVWTSRDAWNEQWEFGIAFANLDHGILQRLKAMNKTCVVY